MDPVIPKYFNVAGPCVPGEHYMLPAIDRLPEAPRLISQKQYFVIHAARQSGKTTLLHALTDEINEEGRHYALYCSLETLQRIEDLDRGLSMIVYELNAAVAASPIFQERRVEEQPAGNVATGIRLALSGFSAALDKPLILFFDEVDCLSGQTLITFLRQLRYGYINRARISFPWSIALVGMRDIRDFRAEVRPGSESLGSASPFNIVTKALTLDNFTREQVAELYRQHTEATGQVFEPEAVERAWYWSEGQPWLVNALARQVVEDDLERDYSLPVTAGHIDAAADALMKRRDTHIDSLLDRLREPRVRKVIEPMLTGADNEVSLLHDDTKFCLDLGLVKISAAGALEPANPIYREVIVRTLTHDLQARMPAELANRWMDGKKLDLTALLRA
ncbi:MAG: AAA-like domain-containing protein, partial [Planctomycetota bacterium]|nr:AAA-like domain-containing protein [Planctomycetota bacterium]